MDAKQDPYSEALDHLQRLIADARQRGDADASTAALATATAQGRPSVRTVDVVRVSATGLVVLADRHSGKGHQLEQNPHAALCFRWSALQYQAIVEGDVVRLPEAEADELWLKQPRDYGLGHWASDATQAALEPVELQQNVRERRQQYIDERVPRPPAWAAYEIRPYRIDFWASGWSRLHSRIRYLKAADERWNRTRENP